MTQQGHLPESAKVLGGKRAVVRIVEGDTVVFESEGAVVRIPVSDLPADIKELVEKYSNWPGVLPGTEVEVHPVRCEHHWHMDDCWAAYLTKAI